MRYDYRRFSRNLWPLSHCETSCCVATFCRYVWFGGHLERCLVLIVVLRGGCSLHFDEQQRPQKPVPAYKPPPGYSPTPGALLDFCHIAIWPLGPLLYVRLVKGTRSDA